MASGACEGVDLASIFGTEIQRESVGPLRVRTSSPRPRGTDICICICICIPRFSTPAADKKDQEQGPDDVTEEERDDMYMRAALNVFMSNRFSDSLPDSTLLGISDVELYRELLGGAD